MNNTKKKVTLSTIAKETGFSTSTVSKVLRGEVWHCRISDEDIQKIRDCIVALGYDNDPNICSSDHENVWEFYADCQFFEYRNNTTNKIAAYAKENIPYFKKMDIDDIIKDHIFLGYEGSSCHASYNGDTYVLFIDPDKLYEDMRRDAYERIESLRKTIKPLHPNPTLSIGNTGKLFGKTAYPRQMEMHNLWCVLWDNFVSDDVKKRYPNQYYSVRDFTADEIKTYCMYMIGAISKKKVWSPAQIFNYYVFPYAVQRAVKILRKDERLFRATEYNVTKLFINKYF